MAKVREQKVKRPYSRKVKPAQVEPEKGMSADVPESFVDHSAPITQEDLERAADDHILDATKMVEPAAAGNEQTPPDMRSLLYFLNDVQPLPPPPPGFFLDFTGHEDLLDQVQSLSDDINSDILALLTALIEGELCRRASVDSDV